MKHTDGNVYKAKGNFFLRILKLPLMHLAWIAPHAKLRTVCHKMRGIHIGKNVEIGYRVMIGNVHPENIYIGDNTTIAANTTILDHDNSYYYSRGGEVKCGKVVIGNNVFIGVGTVIMPGVRIGDGAIIGSLSFVNKDIPAYVVAAGNPVSIIKANSAHK